MSKVQFYGISFLKVFSSFMHSIFYHVKNTYLNEFLRPFTQTVLCAGKIVENTVNERCILIKAKEKIYRSEWVKWA